MNYYNPYTSMYPYMSINPSSNGIAGGLLGKVGSKFSFGSILTNIQKTLGVVNQAIPVVKQINPVVKNAKTMFKVMNEFKKIDTPVTTQKTEQNNSVNEIKENKNTTNSNESYDASTGPTFFV